MMAGGRGKIKLPAVIFSGRISYIVNSFEGELHTHKGVVDLSKLREVDYGGEVRTHLGYPFKVRPLSPTDFFKHFKKGPTPMMPKDVGAIIAYTGLKPGSIILDSGTGSGVLAAYLAYFNTGGVVVTVEKRPEFARIAKRNFELAGLKNIHLLVGDIFELANAFKRKFDLITLDMKNDTEFVAVARDLLKKSGYLVVYNPYIDATRKVYLEMEKNGFEELESFELLKVDLEHKRVGTRPFTKIWHTGFLVIGRKIS